MPTTANRGYPYPSSTDDVRPYEDIQALAEAVDTDVNGVVSAWTSWVPTWTNLTVGNGTVIAKRRTIGKTVTFRLKFTLGSTSVVGTVPTFTLPVTPHADYVFDDPFGIGDALDAGVNSYTMKVRYNTGGIVRLDLTATSPFTFGNGDSFSVPVFTYEAA